MTLLDAVGIWVFAPTDAGVRDAMREAPIVLASRVGARAPVWDAYLGFSLSHGLGLAFVGVIHLLLLRRDPALYSRNPWLLTLSALWAGLWLLLAIRFWFYGPMLIAAAALLCFGWARLRSAPS